MTAPRRWKEDPSELSFDEHRAFEAGLGSLHASLADRRQQSAAKRAVWSALVSKLPEAAIGGASSADLSSGSAGAGGAGPLEALATGGAGFIGTMVKPFGVGLLLGAMTSGGAAAVSHLSAPSAPRAPVEVSAPPTAGPRPTARIKMQPSVPRAAALEQVDAGAAPNPRVTHGDDAVARSATPKAALPVASDRSTASFPAEPPISSAIEPDESRRIATARALLLANRPSEALRVLDAVGRDFPAGLLSQEREALAIETLRALGQRPAARERAVRFLERYPGSPHAAAIRGALE